MTATRRQLRAVPPKEGTPNGKSNGKYFVKVDEDGYLIFDDNLLRAAVKVLHVEIKDGPYKGFAADVQSNITFEQFDILQGVNVQKNREILKEVLIAWNFVDWHGKPLPQPPGGVDKMQIDLSSALINAWGDAAAEAAKLPKDSGEKSETSL